MENTKSNSRPEFYTENAEGFADPKSVLLDDKAADAYREHMRTHGSLPAKISRVEEGLGSLFDKGKEQVLNGAKLAKVALESTPVGAAVKSGIDLAQDPKFKESMVNGAKRAAEVGLSPLAVTASKLGSRLGNDPQVKEMVSNGKEMLSTGIQKTKEMIDSIRGAMPAAGTVIKQTSIAAAETTVPLVGALRRGVAMFEQDHSQVRKQEESISR